MYSMLLSRDILIHRANYQASSADAFTHKVDERKRSSRHVYRPPRQCGWCEKMLAHPLVSFRKKRFVFKSCTVTLVHPVVNVFLNFLHHH